jgi:hypothetical protein
MTKPARMHPALRLALIRRIHTWLGVFVAPSVLFFALTGAAQLYGLHESHGDYRPPAVVERLGMLHKDQVFKLKPKRAKPAKPQNADADHHDADHHEMKAGPKIGTPLLKALFLGVALSLAATTALGVWMALAHGRDRKIAWGLLIAGAVLPALLTLLT